MDPKDVKDLNYITPIENLPSIFKRGILSHKLAKKIPHRSVAMEEIQDRRKIKVVPRGRPLHEYVNLYFDARNPMLYKRRDQHLAICVLKIDPKVMKPAWVALVEILKRIQDEKYHWPVGRTIFQKIAFVATEDGIPTGLRFRRSSYGPFSSEVKPLIAKLSNHQLIQENELGKMFEITVGPTYQDAKQAYADQIEQWEPAIEKTTDLFLRTNTNQAEIIATVLFAGKELKKSTENKPTECDVYESVLRWKQKRRPAIEEDEVASTIRNLAALKWLDVEPSTSLPIQEE